MGWLYKQEDIRSRSRKEIVTDRMNFDSPPLSCKRQLYIYAAYVRERFGTFPALMRFNMFRYGEFVDEPFDLVRFEETLDWVAETIDLIRSEEDWLVSSSGYFCRWICSVRDHCPIAGEIIHARERSVPS